MQRKFVFSVDEYYHVYNRGVDKRVVFVEDKDYFRFIRLLYICNSSEPVVMKELQSLSDKEFFNFKKGEELVYLGAYCLMPNHFHLLIKEKTENGIALFLKKVLTAYSMYFNKKYERRGLLFERPYQATHLDDDIYLNYIYAYIHLNPVKLIDHDWKEKGITSLRKTKDFLAGYRYSSYLDFIGIEREEAKILRKKVFPEYFSDKKEFDDFISEWLNFQGLSLESF
ncbi:MAG: transposase [Candidatus Paceibacterota bacterium]|jgi:putative transposase